jgi:hypothetical protein
MSAPPEERRVATKSDIRAAAKRQETDLLDALKIGSRTFVTAESIVEFLASLPKLPGSAV